MKALRPLLFMLLVGASSWSVAADLDPCFPSKPKDENSLVFQYTKFLSADEAATLDSKLVNFARETSNRIVIIAVDTLCGDEPSDFAFQLGQAWGFGKKGVDNGLLILVKPNGSAGDRHVFIAVGYGLEGAIPDLTAKRVVDEEILPRFRDGDFYGGLDKATDVLMGMAKGEIDAKNYGEEQQQVPWLPLVLGLLFFIFIIVSKVGSAKRYARTNHLDFWAAWALLNAASNRHNGGWGGFSGGGGFGGGGGGGFGGFGGGGFGGGGAGGSW